VARLSNRSPPTRSFLLFLLSSSFNSYVRALVIFSWDSTEPEVGYMCVYNRYETLFLSSISDYAPRSRRLRLASLFLECRHIDRPHTLDLSLFTILKNHHLRKFMRQRTRTHGCSTMHHPPSRQKSVTSIILRDRASSDCC